MARAKRTVRADARRRYRVEQGLAPDQWVDDEVVASTDPAARATASGGSTARPVAGAQPARVGILDAFRRSFRPLDVRGDLAALPGIALHSKALWVPLALTLVSTALVIVVGISRTDLASFLANFVFQFFVLTPATGGVFIAGFLAPRASWLLGIVVGLFAATCFSVVLLAFPLQIGPTAPTPDEASEAVLSGFVWSPVLGALFASAAAWYRRFLAMSNPNRRPRTPVAKRGADGRSRAASQKAPARR